MSSFVDRIRDPVNVSLVVIINLLFMFDRHDPIEAKYLKAGLFLTGLTGIVNVYRYTDLGNFINVMLESKVF